MSEVKKLTNKAVAEALDGLPAYKMNCSVLAEEAIQAALEDYQERSGKLSEDDGENLIYLYRRRTDGAASEKVTAWKQIILEKELFYFL